MQLRHLRVQHFRGIASLQWYVPGGAICLIGPGDSCKTTILDAVQLALGGHWSVPIHDHDFYQRDLSTPIQIDATVTGLPPTLMADERLGLQLRGWNPDGTLHDEPEDADELALTIRFTVDDSLEPSWLAITDRDPEGKQVSWRDRQRLGVARVGAYVDRDFRWQRGSPLARLTDEIDQVDRTLADAHRLARAAIQEADLTMLEEPVRQAREGAVELGAGHLADSLHPALDSEASQARLGLHSRGIPLASFGLGSRRLASLGLQLADAGPTALLLLDELEHALEPFRVRHLIGTLRQRIDDADRHPTQLICTTHSSIAVEHFDAPQLNVVRRDVDGSVTVRAVPAVPDDLQRIARKAPETFLARRILLCEGSTELGMCLVLEAVLKTPWAHVGATLAKGSGSEAAARAQHFNDLGYEVALLVDSDVRISPSPAELATAGVKVVQWDGDSATEKRLFADLPLDGVCQLLNRLADLKGDVVLSELRAELGIDREVGTPDQWAPRHVPEKKLREVAARVIAERGWLKSIPAGECAGAVVLAHWDTIEGTDLHTKLDMFLRWPFDG